MSSPRRSRSPIPTTGNLTDDVVTNARDAGETAVFSRRTADGWVDVTAAEFHDEVRAVAKGLIAAGVEAGDRVALLSKTRYEWTLFDYAIWFAGAVTVPIYETSSAEQIGWILQDSGARAVVAEGPDHLARVREARESGDLAELQHVWSIEDNAVDVLGRLGSDISDDVLEQRRTTATPLDLATLIYTSGTTGKPKGCMLTHGNFMFELGVAVDELGELFDTEDASTLLFLPLAHVFARIIQVGCVKSRARMGHSADIKNLVADLGEFQPTFILAVPRVFEKVFNTASQRATADGRGKVFDRAADVAIAWSRALDGKRVPVRLRAQHALFDRLVYGKLRQALGGSCAYAISGGAPLGDRLGHFYRGIGLDRARGLRPDRDHGRPVRQPPRRHARSARSVARCPARACGSPTTASCSSAAARSSPATGATRPRPARRSTATAGSTPATSARSTTRASSGSPAARRRSS